MNIQYTMTKPKRPRVTNLEMANQMFKDAFTIKMSRFASENPHLSKLELTKLTAQYFRNLSEAPLKLSSPT